jgi:hypothetical protein
LPAVVLTIAAQRPREFWSIALGKLGSMELELRF